MKTDINIHRPKADCTVVIPCHNQGRFLNECISSILAQTTPPMEIIVIDDGSTCVETQKILASQVIKSVAKVIRNETALGLPAARNQGISSASTKYIVPLDADDKIEHTYIEKASKILDEKPNVGIVGGDSLFFGTRSGKTSFPPFSKWRMTVDNCIISSAMFRKSDWKNAGGYCEDLKEGFEDWDFYLSILEKNLDYFHLHGVVYYYRRHKRNMTEWLDKNPKIKINIYIKVYDRHPSFFKQYAAGSMPFLYEERTAQRTFGKNPLITFCRKLLRASETVGLTGILTRFSVNFSFFVILFVTVVLVAGEIYISVFRNSPGSLESVANVELKCIDTAQVNGALLIYGSKKDGGRLPLAFINFSDNGEMPLSIQPAGKSNDKALGSEVWVMSQDSSVAGIFPSNEADTAGWRFNTDIWHQPALVAVGNEGPMTMRIREDKGALFLMRHPWSGRCEIAMGQTKSRFDLYQKDINSVLPVVLLNQKSDALQKNGLLNLKLLVPSNTLVEIGMLKGDGSKWQISNIADEQGRSLKKSKADTYVAASSDFLSPWFWIVPLAFLAILAWLSIKKGAGDRKPFYLFIVLLASTITSFLVMVFYPGVMTPDSFWQWEQAQSGQYNDWHPAGLAFLMSIFQRGLYFVRENTQVAMTAWLTGFFFWISCHLLIWNLLRNVKLALLASLLILSYYPFWPYSIILWKDVLYAAGMFCFAATVLHFSNRQSKPPGLAGFLLMLLLGVIMLLNRQTAWAVMLACLPGVIILTGKMMRLRISIIYVLAIVGAFAATKVIYFSKNVASSGNLTNVFFAFDLVGTLRNAKAYEDEISHLKTTGVVGMENMQIAISRYDPESNMNYLFFNKDSPFPIDRLLQSRCVLEDFPRVAAHHPWALIKHKLSVQKILWDRNAAGHIWYAYQTVTDQWGNHEIYPNSKFPKANEVLRKWLDAAPRTPGSFWQLFLRNNIVFLTMLLIIMIAIAIAGFRGQCSRLTLDSCFLAWAAFSCWLPYALVLPSADWRYMLPTTGIAVIVIICNICNLTVSLKPKGSPPLRRFCGIAWRQ